MSPYSTSSASQPSSSDEAATVEKDIVAKATFVKDPMQANNQKRAFAEQVAHFDAGVKKGSAYTDITGGIKHGCGGRKL